MLILLVCPSGGLRFVQSHILHRSKCSSTVQAAFEAYKEKEFPNLKVEVRIFIVPLS